MGLATRHLRTEREATAETLKIGPAIVTRCGEAGVTRDFALFNANSNKIDPRALEEFRDPVCTCGDEPVLAAVQQKPGVQMDERVAQTVGNKPSAYGAMKESSLEDKVAAAQANRPNACAPGVTWPTLKI